MKNILAFILAYFFGNTKKSGLRFQRSASRHPATRTSRRRPATQPGRVEPRTILVNWPDGRTAVLVV